MMCYKDKTFCTQSTCANWNTCDRALTDEVKEQADKWWGKPGAPIAIFTDKPNCYEKSQ